MLQVDLFACFARISTLPSVLMWKIKYCKGKRKHDFVTLKIFESSDHSDDCRTSRSSVGRKSFSRLSLQYLHIFKIFPSRLDSEKFVLFVMFLTPSTFSTATSTDERNTKSQRKPKQTTSVEGLAKQVCDQ